jgi:hypothetical protein
VFAPALSAANAAVLSAWAVVSKPGFITSQAAMLLPPALVTSIVPVTSEHVSPVIPVPAAGLNPTSPDTEEVGTLVTAVAPRIAKLFAVPSDGEVAAETLLAEIANIVRSRILKIRILTFRGKSFIFLELLG